MHDQDPMVGRAPGLLSYMDLYTGIVYPWREPASGRKAAEQEGAAVLATARRLGQLRGLDGRDRGQRSIYCMTFNARHYIVRW